MTDALRERVRFLEGNLVDESLLILAPPYDVIFCRNILIYLDRRARQIALAVLDRLLADGGFLIAGHADVLDGQDVRFRSLTVPGAFAYQRASPRAHHATSPPRGGIAPAPIAPAVAARPPESPPALERIADLANERRFGEAATLCEEQLGHDPQVDPEVYSLLGAIRIAEGRLDAAEFCFQRALYLDRNHYESLIQLALVCDRRGDPQAAARVRRRAKRAASRLAGR